MLNEHNFTHLGIGFSYRGLNKLTSTEGISQKSELNAFTYGIGQRSGLLGDPMNSNEYGNYSNWIVKEPDILLVIAGD